VKIFNSLFRSSARFGPTPCKYVISVSKNSLLIIAKENFSPRFFNHIAHKKATPCPDEAGLPPKGGLNPSNLETYS
jgi:hypothetical protein